MTPAPSRKVVGCTATPDHSSERGYIEGFATVHTLLGLSEGPQASVLAAKTAPLIFSPRANGILDRLTTAPTLGGEVGHG